MQNRIQKLASTLAPYRRYWPAAAALAVLAFLGVLLSIDAGNPPKLALMIGRMHPLVLHLPIGFLLLAGILEYLSRWPRFADVRHAVPYTLVLSALGAVAAATAGYFLSMEGYSGATFDWHKWLGIGVAVLACALSALWFLRNARPSPVLERAYTSTLLSALSLLMVASHLGGTLTHGEGYLTEHAPEPVQAAIAALTGGAQTNKPFERPDDAVIYRDLVHPILESRCVSCHGADKQKGQLRLDTPEGIKEGGDGGPVLVAGRAANSELLKRIWLPADHDDVMPPRGRQPLSAAEAELLRWWVDQGASFDQILADVEVPAMILPAVEGIVGPLSSGQPAILAVEVAPPDPEALAQAESIGFTISPLSDGTGFLNVHTTNLRGALSVEQLNALLPIAEQITWLSFSGSEVNDASLAVLSKFTNLSRLHLDRTSISDATLAHLSGLEHLEYLNLYDTKVTDAGLSHLSGLENLRSLYLWKTAVTQQGIDQLTQKLPRLRANLGTDLPPPDTSATSPTALLKTAAQ